MALRIDDTTEEVLEEFDTHGNLTTGALVDFTGYTRPTVTKRLDRLHAAECIRYIHEPTALWQLVDDPREESS